MNKADEGGGRCGDERRQARRMIWTPSGDVARPFRVGWKEKAREAGGKGTITISRPDEIE